MSIIIAITLLSVDVLFFALYFIRGPKKHLLLLFGTAVYLFVGVVGFLFYTYFNADYKGTYYAIFHLEENYNIKALSYYLAAICIIYVIYSLAHTFRPIKSVPVQSGADNHAGGVGSRKKFDGRVYLVVAWLLFLIYVSGRGFGNVIYGAPYLSTYNRLLTIIGTLGLLPTAFILGWIRVSGRGRILRALSMFSILLVGMTLVSLATRLVIVVVTGYLIGYIYGKRSIGKSKIALMFWFLLLPIMFYLPLYLRGGRLGLVNLPSNVLFLVSSNGIINLYFNAIEKVVMSMTFGLPLSYMVAHSQKIPPGYFATEISPMPSFIVIPGIPGWYDIAPMLRISAYMPYNAIGELINYGLAYFFFYYFLIGIAVFYFDRLVFRLRRNNSGIFRMVFVYCCVILVFLSLVLSTQYNLRASTRFIYDALFLVIMYDLLARFIGLFSRKRRN